MFDKIVFVSYGIDTAIGVRMNWKTGDKSKECTIDLDHEWNSKGNYTWSINRYSLKDNVKFDPSIIVKCNSE